MDQLYDKVGKKLYTATVMPIRGAWLEYETDSNDVFWVRIDRTRKLPVTSLLRAIGLDTDEKIIDFFGEDEKILAKFERIQNGNMQQYILFGLIFLVLAIAGLMIFG